MYQSKPIFKQQLKQNIASCSSDNCDCCDIYYSTTSSEASDSLTSLTSTSSTSDTASTCSCDNNQTTGEQARAKHQQELKQNRIELNWIDHFTDRNSIVNYIKYLDDEDSNSAAKLNRATKSVKKRFKKR